MNQSERTHLSPGKPDPGGRHPGTSPETGRGLLFALGLMFAMFIGTFPQYALGVLGPVLTVELSITEFQFGMVASVLYLSAATVARLTGRRIDRTSGRVALGLLFLTSTGSLIVLASGRSLLWLAAAVLLAGVAIGANNPVTNRLIAVHVASGRRGFVIGIKQIGVKLAHVASGVVVPVLTLTFGWRQGLVMFAAAALSIAALALLVVPRDVGPRRDAAATPTPAGIRERVRWLRYFAGFMAIGTSAITTYLPLYAVQNVGMSLVQGGLVVTVFGSVAVVARLAWATLADRRGRPEAVLLVLSGVAAVSLAIISASELLGPWVLWLGAVLAGGTVGSWNSVAHLTVVSVVEAQRAAAATGLLQATFMLGLAVGAPLFGFIVESSGSFQFAWLVAGVLSMAAFTAAWRERRRQHLAPQASAAV